MTDTPDKTVPTDPTPITCNCGSIFWIISEEDVLCAACRKQRLPMDAFKFDAKFKEINEISKGLVDLVSELSRYSSVRSAEIFSATAELISWLIDTPSRRANSRMRWWSDSDRRRLIVLIEPLRCGAGRPVA